jgi:hypothetical protein
VVQRHVEVHPPRPVAGQARTPVGVTERHRQVVGGQHVAGRRQLAHLVQVAGLDEPPDGADELVSGIAAELRWARENLPTTEGTYA